MSYKSMARNIILIGISTFAVSFASPQQLPPGATSEIGVSPDGQSLEVFLKAIGEAKEETLVAAYSFTGSFNYSAAADSKNVENVIISRNAPEIATTYTTEWKCLWNEAEALAPKY